MKPIDHYLEIIEWHMINQKVNGKSLCSACGEEIKARPDLAHVKSRTEDNLQKWPLFTDSIINTSAQHRGCNVNRYLAWGKEPPSDLLCEKAEKYLRDNPKICEYVNGPGNHEFSLDDIWDEIKAGFNDEN
jgi:hypothetical protein